MRLAVLCVGLVAPIFACSSSSEPLPPLGDGTFTVTITGAVNYTTTGFAYFDPRQPLQDPLITLQPIPNTTYVLFLFLRNGYPPEGDHQVGTYNPAARLYGRLVDEFPPGGGAQYESESGTAHLTVSSVRGVVGTASFTAVSVTQPPVQINVTFSAKPL